MKDSDIAVNRRSATSEQRTRPALALWLLGLLSAPLVAQDAPATADIRVEGDNIVFSLANENQGMPLRDFIKMAQLLTGKVITYPIQEVENEQNNIHFLGTVTVQQDEFFGFFQTMLYIKDFGIVVRGKGTSAELVEVIFMKSARNPEINSSAPYVPIEDLGLFQNQTGVQILTSIPLRHLDAAKAGQQLRPFFAGANAGGKGLNFGNAGNQKSLLLQGFGPQVFQAWRLLQLVDVPEEVIDLVVETVSLEHAAAEELEPLLSELLSSQLRQVQAAAARGGGAGVAQAPEMKVLAQPSINMLIISGSREQVADAKDLIAVLDRPLDVADGDSHIITIRNMLVSDLRDTMNQFIDEERAAETQAQAGQQATTARRPRSPVVVAHDESNKLLVSAPSTKFAQLRRMIEELDERQRQVLIECAVVELSTIDLERYGVELGFLDIRDDGNFTRPFGFTNFGQSQFEDTDDDGLPDTRLPDFENPLQGFTGGILRGSGFSIPVLLNALASADEANVLSLPSVIVNNNVTAVVESKESRPTQDQSQGTATTVTTAGQEVEAGISLTISPSISSNDYLRLNIDLEVSRFITAFDPGSPTAGVRTTRILQTQVTMPNGKTMVLGGVIEDQEAVSDSGIPILMDIPLIGWMFRTHVTDNRKTNLYFFLTPHILDEEDFSDLDAISTRKKLEAASYIGERRMEIVDPKWDSPDTLDDPGASLEALDAGLAFEFPNYLRPRRDPDGSLDPNTPPLPIRQERK